MNHRRHLIPSPPPCAPPLRRPPPPARDQCPPQPPARRGRRAAGPPAAGDDRLARPLRAGPAAPLPASAGIPGEGLQPGRVRHPGVDQPGGAARAGDRAQDPGTLRVLALGDSFAFGVGARRGYLPARLQEVLRSRGVRAEVLNAGAPGYGVPDETAWYERWGKPLAPDVILVTVFIGNDLQDAVPGPKPAAVDGALVMPGERSGSLSRWLYYHSQLFVLIKNSSLGASLRRLLGRQEPLEKKKKGSAGEFDLYAKEEASEMVRQDRGAGARRGRAGRGRRQGARPGGDRPLADPGRSPALAGQPPALRARSRRLRPGASERDLPGGIFGRHGVPVLT